MPSKNAQNASQTKNTVGNAPLQTFRYGRIKATIWENEANKKKFYSVTFARTYMGEDKQLHDAASFGRDQLPLVAKLADQAHAFIFALLAQRKVETLP